MEHLLKGAQMTKLKEPIKSVITIAVLYLFPFVAERIICGVLEELCSGLDACDSAPSPSPLSSAGLHQDCHGGAA